jgi:hypothetical protein
MRSGCIKKERAQHELNPRGDFQKLVLSEVGPVQSRKRGCVFQNDYPAVRHPLADLMQTAQDGFVNINIDVCGRDLFNLIRQFPADDFKLLYPNRVTQNPR